MNRLLQWATSRWLLALTAALMLYTLAGFSLVPVFIQHYTPRLAADVLKRQASIDEVQFNPFLFTFEAKNVAFREANGRPLLEFKRLFLDLEPTRFLTGRTLALADLRLDEPSANLVLERNGKLNLAKIAESLSKSEEPPSAEKPLLRFVLNRLTLTDGAIKFTDFTASPPINETIKHLSLELNDISTLPDRQGAYRIDAGLPDGSKLAWRGDVTLSPATSSGELKIEALHLTTLWNFMKDRLNLAEPSGEISFTTRYKFSYAKDKTELSISDGTFKLSGLRLTTTAAKEPLLTLAEARLNTLSINLAGRTVRVPSLTLHKGTVSAATDEKGQLNWLRLLKSANAIPKPATPAEPPLSGPPWKVAVEKLDIADISLKYSDNSRKSPFVITISDFGLTLGAELEAGISTPKVRADDIVIHLSRIGLIQPGKAAPLVGWDSFVAEGGRFDLEKQEAALKRAVLKGGGTAIIREADGTLHPFDLFATEKPADSMPTPGTDSNTLPQPGANPWHFSLDEFALQGFGVALTDRSLSPPLTYNFDGIQMAVKNITNDGKTPAAFDTKLKIRQGGTLQASGTASPKGETARVKITIDRFDLRQLQPFFGQFAALKIDSANLSSDLDVDFRQGELGPSVKATGDASLNNLVLKQSKDGKRFLAWKSLSANGLKFGLAPDGLSITEVRIVEPDTAITIAQDHSTNIAAVFNPETPEPAKSDTPTPASGKPFPISVERVRLDDGRIDFSDMSLVLPFATHIHDFAGTVTGISMDPKNRTTLRFTGRVDEYGEVRVDGALNPMKIKDFSDIRVVFRNIPTTSLSPYSATFAGRKIESGKLNLDLDYKIENSHLKSQNKIVLDQFTLGEKVESPSALDLPLDLAIALLTDNTGKIQAAIPIEGDVGNPKFDYGALVWKAFANLVKKVVTSPFSAIASVFGDAENHFDAVLFETAKDAVPPPEREKLSKVAAALTQRPKLRLIVHGQFNPKLDGEALKSLEVRRDLARKMGVALAPDEEPDTVSFDNGATQRALEKLVSERGGGIAEAAQADYVKRTGKPPQRIGPIAGLVGRTSDTPEFYEHLFKRLVEAMPLPPADLKALAARRGLAVVAELTDQQNLDKARVSVGNTESTQESADGKVPTRLELVAE